MFILVHIDDIIIIRSSNDEVTALGRKLNAEFSRKELRDLNYFLGIKMK